MGQSNMAGWGQLETEDQTPHPRVLVFTLSNQWEAAVEPITRDRTDAMNSAQRRRNQKHQRITAGYAERRRQKNQETKR